MKQFILLGCALFLLTGCGNKINSVKTIVDSGMANLEQVNSRKADAETISAIIKSSNRNLWDSAIKKGIMINGFNKSTFRYACENGSKDFAYYLIDHGIDINYVDKDGKNELMYLNKWTYRPLYEKFVKKLVQSGCDINAIDNLGHTVVEDAIMMSKRSRVNELEEYMKLKTLLDQGAKLRKETLSLICDSHFAYYTSLKELSKKILEEFGDTSPENCIEAVFLKDSSYLNINLNLNKSEMTEAEEITVAFYTAALGDQEELRRVLERLQVPLDIKDARGNTLLMAAAAAGNQDTFFYLEDKIPHDTINEYHQTLLVAALSGENREIIDSVFYHNKEMWNYNTQVEDGKGYLLFKELSNILAFCKDEKFIIEYLDSAKLLDDDLEQLCKVLIEKDNITFLNLLFKIPEMKAVYEDAGQYETILGYCYTSEQVKFLLQYADDDVKEQLSPALAHILGRKYVILEEPVPIIKEFLKAGVDVDAADAPIPPIWEAVSAGDTESVKELISQNVDVNALLKHDGRSPLMMASRGDVVMMELLLQNGAEVNLVTKGGSTALSYAVVWSNAEGVKLLLEKGAEKTLIPQEKPSLYDIAKKNGDKDIMEMLKD